MLDFLEEEALQTFQRHTVMLWRLFLDGSVYPESKASPGFALNAETLVVCDVFVV